MKKTIKILTLILIVVFVLSVFAGCDLVGRNVAKYRSAVALKIGGQEVTVGKLLDTFNSYYNNYYYYISAGYLDASQLLNMAISSLVQQYMQLDDYVTNSASEKYNVSGLQAEVKNAEYLTADEFAYAVKYVNYLAYNAFDQYTEDNITGKYDLEAAPTEDTSRDFTEYDPFEVNGNKAETYAQYLYESSFVSEDADKYFEKNYSFLTKEQLTSGLYLDGYVYDTTDATQKAKAEERVKEYNDRRTDDEQDELTLDEYIEILKDTQKQYRETVQNNYGVTLDEFLKNQLGDMVTSSILTKWSYQCYKDIESDSKLEETLKNFFDDAKKAQQADFNISDNFDSFITSLGTDSNIYNLDDDAGNYVFVKNILIPFSSAQTTLLSNLQNQLGSAEASSYIKERTKLAAQIVAQYFDSDKYDEELEKKFDKATWFVDKNADKEDEDSLWNAKVNVFSYDEASNKISVNPNGVLGQFLKGEGRVEAMDGKSKDETIIELMKRFNTDTAQHTAAFDYVVYVGNDWKDYSHSWVKEFYTAVNEDLVERDGDSITVKENAYTLCVSSYGVHIIYLTSSVKDSDKLFTEFKLNERLENGSPSYNLFKTYFDSKQNANTEKAFKDLKVKKLENSDYITITGGFTKFLKDNGLTFDLDEFIADMLAE